MSTTINVTVDDGGLPAKNRQQTAANRQAFVQGQASRQAAQQGADQRAADRRAAGLDPATGRPLASAGASSRLPRIEQEPAANRRGGVPLAGLAWNFTRLKEQPTIFYSRATSDGPCSAFPNIGGGRLGWYTKLTTQAKIYSGDGSTGFSFDYGYDLTSVWNAPAANGQNMSTGLFGGDPSGTWTAGVPSIGSFGPTNPAFPDVNPIGSGDSKVTSFSIWLPTGNGSLIYYFYHKVQTATQKASNQLWANCALLGTTPGAIFGNLYNVGSPQLTVNTIEVCLRVTRSAVQEIEPPNALRSLLLSCFPSYDIVNYPRIRQAGAYEGAYAEASEIPGYIWSVTPATNSLSSLISGKNSLYVATDLPGTSNSDYYITTGGIYETLVADEAFDYDRIRDNAPTISGVIDQSGFGAAQTWGGIYDDSTAFNHSATKSSRVPPIIMSTSRLGRPSDSLVYTSPEGFILTSNWSTQAIICYNWANSSYCSQQLLSLGFNPSQI